ncbi:MAG: cupin domain-containing protein [Marinobacter sp.]|uniref:cupin domain-containing protein n=1 Tax=Marinobacter sp. TaxID=50741 RepID=UPI0032D97CD3
MISKESAEHYHWGNGCDGWHLVKSSNLSVIQERVPSGCGEIRHFHKHSEQFFFVLAGVASLEVNGETHTLRSHQGLHVKAKMPHQLKNEHSEDLVFTVTSTPPSHGDRVEL